MPLAIVTLIVVLLGITIRNLLPFHIPVWFIMCLGALFVVITGQMSLDSAYRAIDFEVIFYLFGVFMIAEGLESSGLLERFTETLFNYNVSAYFALMVIIFVLGLSAALLMNDAIAIIGTPIILQLCGKRKQLTGIFLMALAFAITVGSVISPIGNPQNLLIAVQSGMSSPFVTFLFGLALPTLICLVILYIVFVILYKNELKNSVDKLSVITLKNKRLALVSLTSFILFISLVLTKIVFDILKINMHFNFAMIAMMSALPIILFSNTRRKNLKNLDWGTLIFFIAMFILMQAVWNSGFFQRLMQQTHFQINNIPAILGISTIMSQFISNVPLVALYIPLLKHLGANIHHYLALAVGSTLAGNIFIFGAASNMIIIQNAEKRGYRGFKVGLFSLLGIPLTAVFLTIYAGLLG